MVGAFRATMRDLTQASVNGSANLLIIQSSQRAFLMLQYIGMDSTFSAREFLERLSKGLLDGRLNEELQSLSREQLEEVASLLTERLLKNRNPS